MSTSEILRGKRSEHSSDFHHLNTAGIIAAGKGSRMRSEGMIIPKPLIPVGGVPLIQRLITTFASNGITDVICLVNEESPEVREFLESNDFGITIRILVKSTSSSMQSLFTLAPHLMSSPFLLSTVDNVFRSDEFTRYINYVRDRTAYDSVLALTNFIYDEKPLCVKVDENMRITDFSDRKDGFEWATGGLYYFTPRIFDAVEEALYFHVKRFRNFLRMLLDHNYSIYGYAFSKIIDVDHVSDIRVAEQFIRQETGK